MKKSILIAFALLVSITSVCNAQNSTSCNDIKNRSIRIGYGLLGGNFDPGQVILTNSDTGNGSLLNINADLFRVTNSIRIGAHLGVGRAAKQDSLYFPTLMHNTVGIHYGIDLSYSILENAGFNTDKWDLRLDASIGGYWIFLIAPQLEYGAGISAAYYPLKHFGIYGDLMWGRFLYNGNGNSHLGEGHRKIEIGLSYRF